MTTCYYTLTNCLFYAIYKEPLAHSHHGHSKLSHKTEVDVRTVTPKYLEVRTISLKYTRDHPDDLPYH